jgi:biopolymer transport protein ExbB
MSPANFLTLIEDGGVVMYPLLLCSIITVAVTIERWWTIMRAARSSAKVHRVVVETVAEGSMTEALALVRRDPSPLAATYKALLSATDTDEASRERLARRHHGESVRFLKRYIWLLGTIGSLAPFIGLFGTVLGIIRSFEDMAATGSGGFAVVAAGISEALIATAGGLLVGVLAIFAYNALLVRINNVTARWRDWVEEILGVLENRPPRPESVPRVVQSRG